MYCYLEIYTATLKIPNWQSDIYSTNMGVYILQNERDNLYNKHARIQKVLSEGVQSLTFFLVDEGRRIQIPLQVGHHWPASETPFKWRFAGVPMMTEHLMLA